MISWLLINRPCQLLILLKRLTFRTILPLSNLTPQRNLQLGQEWYQQDQIKFLQEVVVTVNWTLLRVLISQEVAHGSNKEFQGSKTTTKKMISTRPLADTLWYKTIMIFSWAWIREVKGTLDNWCPIRSQTWITEVHLKTIWSIFLKRDLHQFLWGQCKAHSNRISNNKTKWAANQILIPCSERQIIYMFIPTVTIPSFLSKINSQHLAVHSVTSIWVRPWQQQKILTRCKTLYKIIIICAM